MSNHLEMLQQRQHILLSYFKTPNAVAVQGLNPQLPAQQEHLRVQKEMTGTHPNLLLDNLISIISFPTFRLFEGLQNSRTKIDLSDRHFSCPQYQRTLFVQLIYSCFLVTIFPLIAWLHFRQINTHTTHNSSNRCDEGLTLQTSAFKLFTVANLHYQLS